LCLVEYWGLKTEKNGVWVDSIMRTSREGIFACGDMIYYPGKLRLLISACGEATLAAETAYQYIRSKFGYHL
ncbi:MAG: NAD(P)/FAD-dependent oxidoreductase, partial [Fidelibacterota bacterium]